jgi:hypothetical protein
MLRISNFAVTGAFSSSFVRAFAFSYRRASPVVDFFLAGSRITTL